MQLEEQLQAHRSEAARLERQMVEREAEVVNLREELRRLKDEKKAEWGKSAEVSAPAVVSFQQLQEAEIRVLALEVPDRKSVV